MRRSLVWLLAAGCVVFASCRPGSKAEEADKGLRILETTTGEVQFKDGFKVVIETYAAWTVADQRQFDIALRSDPSLAEKELASAINSVTALRIGKALWAQISEEDANDTEARFDEIETDILAQVRNLVVEREYGLEIVAFGIRRMDVPQRDARAVFERMRQVRKELQPGEPP